MPFETLRLDNQVPPVWESFWGGSNPEADDPYIDVESRLRPTLGDDKVNYWVRQRIEGDLFKRDLINGLMIRRVADYLGARMGLNYAIPETYSLYGSTIKLGQITEREEIAGYYFVGYSITADTVDLDVISDLSVRIVDLDDNVLLSFNPVENAEQHWAVVVNAVSGARGDLLTGSFKIELVNASGETDVAVTASVILAPKMSFEADTESSGSSTSSGP